VVVGLVKDLLDIKHADEMKNANRDLLVLIKDAQLNEKEIEQAVKQLNFLLLTQETVEVFCSVTDVINISKNKIITNPRKIKAIISQPTLQPFVFIYNKN
jgi:hypothetical protein